MHSCVSEHLSLDRLDVTVHWFQGEGADVGKDEPRVAIKVAR